MVCDCRHPHPYHSLSSSSSFVVAAAAAAATTRLTPVVRYRRGASLLGFGGGVGDTIAQRNGVTAVHVRRSDKGNQLSNQCLAAVLDGVRNVHIYSDGAPSEFGKLAALPGIEWHLNTGVIETHRAL